jgi:glycosyltransferase involved in cell wall biosynthesis
MRVSAYVPCYNNAATIVGALDSLRQQSVPLSELFVIDDGSTDNSAEIARAWGARVIRHEVNAGRGAARSRAVQEAAHELILGCDATNALPPDFAERARIWFDSGNVAAVFGRICQKDHSTVAQRWRARHLFKTEARQSVNRHASLSTWGVLMRKTHVLSVGNFNSALRHSEDAELGKRLLAKGHEVVYDPQIEVLTLARNSLPQVLERYWRWNAGKDEHFTLKGYLKQVVFSFKVMAHQDLCAGDPLSVPISLISPHYQFWKSFTRKHRKLSPS